MSLNDQYYVYMHNVQKGSLYFIIWYETYIFGHLHKQTLHMLWLMRTLKNKQTKWRHEAWRGSLNEDTPDIYSTDHMEGGEGEGE